jgi:tetratricopeptide (TPR) repeat protein
MLDITPESLIFRRQCIEEFAGDTLDRMIMRIHCDACDFRGENSALVATTGFGFESMKQLREVIERIINEGERVCPGCDDPLVDLEKVFYLAYSETLQLDFIAEFDPPVKAEGRWLIACYLQGKKTERISVADERLREIFRETLLRAAASASELGSNPDLAKKLIERAVDLFGSCSRNRYLLATICRENGEYGEALETLSDMVEDEEECRRSLFEIGVTHFAALRDGKDQVAEAFTAFSTVLEFDEKHAPAHLYLGNIYLGLGRFEESLEHFEAAVEINDAMMEGHFNAGIALKNMERPEDAKSHFLRAHELSPDDTDVVKRLVETAEALGFPEEASLWETRLTALENDGEAIQGSLEDLGLL